MINNLDLNSISDVILESDSTGTIIDVNDSVRFVFGYSPKDLIGKKFDILMPERYRGNHSKLFRGYQNNPISRRMGDYSQGKFIGADKSGNEFYIDINLSQNINEEGNKSYFAIIRDISRLIGLNNQLEEVNSTLEAKNEELEQYAYIISHDLKAPTRATSILVDIIFEDYMEKLDPEVVDLFMKIKQRNKRMSDLIDGVLSYSRAGQIKQPTEIMNLDKIVEEIVETLAVPPGIKVELKSPNITFQTQKTQFLQVLSNLVGNAIKYHDKEKGRIEILATKTIDEIEIHIKDDGPGIPKEFHSTIFEMFGTANTKSRTDSTGIGLAIVKKIVLHNQGHISLNSEPGKGSEFIFTFRIEAENGLH